MPLINLTTNLKDLKFGYDRSNGGSSREPFIQTRIPATNEPLQTNLTVDFDFNASINNLEESLPTILGGAAVGATGGAIVGGGIGALGGALVGLGLGIAGAVQNEDFSVGLEASVSIEIPTAGTGGNDFLIRGGTLLPNIIAKDVTRLVKYFKSVDGVLFSIKQNLLSRTGVRTQGAPFFLNERLYTPISTVLGAVGSPFGLHVNKQGLNPFLGLGSDFVPDRYFEAISINLIETKKDPREIFSNRLVGLYGSKILQANILESYYKKNRITPPDNVDSLLSYGGGPNSFLGIGKTNIKFATNTTGVPLRTSTTWKGYTANKNYTDRYATLDSEQLNLITGLVDSNPDTTGIGDYTRPKVVDFRRKIQNQLKSLGISPSSPSYSTKNIENSTNIGDPGNPFQKKLNSYTSGYGSNVNDSYGAASPYSYDKINALPVYQKARTNDPLLYKDLVNFRIGVIDNNNPIAQNKTYIHFRAFLDQIADSYTSNWDPTKYIGRGENFYTYAGFDRKLSLSWTVAAQSKIELMPMYRKLNYLASLSAPDYSDSGYMRGNIITLTIGGYIYEQPGIMTGFNFEMNSELDSWEIAINDEGDEDVSVKQVPHLIKVTGFNFIPIHQFVPRKQQNRYSDETGIVARYGNERFLSLNNGVENPYSWDQPGGVDLEFNPSSGAPDQDSILGQFTTPGGEFNPNLMNLDPVYIDEGEFDGQTQ